MPERTVPSERPVPLTLSHLVLRTAHLDEAVEFYDRLLGMKPVGSSPQGAALSHDGEHHRIALASVPPAEDADPTGPGIEHIAYKLRSLPDLLGNYQRVKKLGLEPFLSIHHGGTLSAYYLDPDGVQIEVFIDTQVTDLSLEAMHSEKFRQNPIGVPVDFDELVRRYEAGEAVSTLLEQPALEEGQLEMLLEKVRAARMARA